MRLLDLIVSIDDALALQEEAVDLGGNCCVCNISSKPCGIFHPISLILFFVFFFSFFVEGIFLVSVEGQMSGLIMGVSILFFHF